VIVDDLAADRYLAAALRAFEHSVMVIATDFRILAANARCRQRFMASGIGQPCHLALYGLRQPCEGCPAVLLKEGPNRPSQTALLPDPAPNRTCLHAYPIYQQDAIDAMVILDLKIPTLETLEERLRRSNGFLRNLILSAVDGVIAADRSGRILIFNDAAAEISGYSVEEALDHLNIREVYPDDGARDIMRKLRSDDQGGRGKLKQYRVEVLRKDGHTIPISLNAAIIHEGEQEVATIGFFHDMREEMRIQKELEKAQIQLLQSEKMASLGKLAAGVAHQLNNPLGSITLFARLVMEEYNLDPGAREDLHRILKDAERCRDTVKELLEFARQTRQEMRPLDINRAIQRTMFLLENQSLFQNIEVVKDLAEGIPQVMGDIQQLNHMFMNIILNAAQAMEGKGRLTLHTALAPGGDRVVIAISDTGPGIAPEVLPHIFEPFFTTKEEGQGTGIGLSLVYGIVENHRGAIRAVNAAPRGTSFIIELPLSHDDGHGENAT
jgi:two-component system NtrC family sensor kinase